MRGRKAIPTALQRVRGNPGRRPLNDREPTYPAIDAAIPDEVVDDCARAEWTRLIATLTTSGHVTTVDRTALAGYCVRYGAWRRLEDLARDAEPTVVNGRTGTESANPVLRLTHGAFTLMLRAAAELGLTPSSRSRIVAVPPKDAPGAADPFTTFQRSRPRAV
jgi:P27 family predicted phage terminase small subunit